MLYFWNPDDSLIPNMMIDNSPWSSCSRQSPWSPWLPCSSPTFSSTMPSVSPFRDFSAWNTDRKKFLYSTADALVVITFWGKPFCEMCWAISWTLAMVVCVVLSPFSYCQKNVQKKPTVPLAEGGGLKLFGQCPYRNNTFQKRTSLGVWSDRP